MPILPGLAGVDTYGAVASRAAISLVAIVKLQNNQTLREEEKDALGELPTDLARFSQRTDRSGTSGPAQSFEIAVYGLAGNGVARHGVRREPKFEAAAADFRRLREALDSGTTQDIATEIDLGEAETICIELLEHIERLRPAAGSV